jgi:hypothetical protein
VFTARYALSPYIKQIRFVFKGLKTPRHYLHDVNASGSATLTAKFGRGLQIQNIEHPCLQQEIDCKTLLFRCTLNTSSIVK